MRLVSRGGAGHAAARVVLSACVYNQYVEGPVKERLTGALILVAALVIIVPEMLLGPDPKTGAAVTPAQPADAGAPLRTYSMVLDGSADPHAAGQATPATQPPTAEPPVETTRPVATAGEPATSATASAHATAVQLSPAVADPPVAPEQPDPVASAPSAGRWWTQLDSFSVRDNADRLASQVRAAGFAIDVTKVGAGGKELYRVRAGPVRDRTEALALQARLAAAGHKSSIVAP